MVSCLFDKVKRTSKMVGNLGIFAWNCFYTGFRFVNHVERHAQSNVFLRKNNYGNQLRLRYFGK